MDLHSVASMYQRKPEPHKSQVREGEFDSAKIAPGEERPQHRTGIHCEYNNGQWGFLAKEQGGGSEDGILPEEVS